MSKDYLVLYTLSFNFGTSPLEYRIIPMVSCSLHSLLTYDTCIDISIVPMQCGLSIPRLLENNRDMFIQKLRDSICFVSVSVWKRTSEKDVYPERKKHATMAAPPNAMEMKYRIGKHSL